MGERERKGPKPRRRFIAAIASNSSLLDERSKSKMQLVVTLMAKLNMPIITGKTRTAINKWLCRDLAASAEIKVSSAEKPTDMRSNRMKKRKTSRTKLANSKAKSA